MNEVETRNGGLPLLESDNQTLVLSESEMLEQVRRRGALRPNVKRAIINGTRTNPFLSPTPGYHVINGSCADKRIHLLMDDLYGVYMLDPETCNGTCMRPFIRTLRDDSSTEFHLYLDFFGITKGFFVSFERRFKDVAATVTMMTFIWVVPRYRRQGLFSRMYKDLVASRGSVLVDHPNDVCQIALNKLGYRRKQVLNL